jgi:hypothetical protein
MHPYPLKITSLLTKFKSLQESNLKKKVNTPMNNIITI